MNKKYILSILILILLCITNSVYAGDYYEFKWSNTYINVELNDNISAYTDKVSAKLYRNGAHMSDALITYNINGDWLYYLKDVDTSKIGEYKVWYKAYEKKYNPGTCNNYKVLVTFNVRDTKSKLEIKVLGDYDSTLNANVLKVGISDKRVDYIKDGYIVIKSKYSFSHYIDDKAVNYQVPDLYKCSLKAIDHNNIEYNVIFYVRIIDNTSPILHKKKDLITIEKSNININWDDYLVINDNIEDKYDIKLLNVNYNIIDVVQNAMVRVTDSNNNSSTILFDVLVLDSIKPIITLSTDSIELEYNKIYNSDEFLKYLDTAIDGDVDISYLVEIDISKLGLAVGDYKVYYSVVDDDGNSDVKELNVRLRSKEPPIIVVNNVTLNINEKVNYKDYIKVIDKSCDNLIDEVNIDDSAVDYTKAGTYFVIVSVMNTSNLNADNYIKVTIVEDSNNINIIKIVAVVALVVIVSSVYFYKKKKSVINEDI